MGPELSSSASADTDHICADCEKVITYTEEAFLIQVVQAKAIDGTVVFLPVIDEGDVAGDFLYEPFLYCFECWEAHYWDLKQEADDIPPVQDPHSVIECVCCGSGIREWEYVGTFTLGELQPSRRLPNNVRGARFTQTGKSEAICLYCLLVFNDNYIVMWDELSQAGECADCVLARCWRHSTCGCGCHDETANTETT